MSEIVTLDERKALLWLRKHQPCDWLGRDAPPGRLRLKLIRDGLVHFWPGRRQFDPIRYSLTERGEKVLSP